MISQLLNQITIRINAAFLQRELGNRFMRDPYYILKTLPETKRAEFELCKEQVTERAKNNTYLCGNETINFYEQGPMQRLAVMAYFCDLNKSGKFKGKKMNTHACVASEIIRDMMLVTDRFFVQPPSNINVCLNHAESLWGRALFAAIGANHRFYKIPPIPPLKVSWLRESVRKLEEWGRITPEL